MTDARYLEAFAALSHPARLQVFRRLLAEAPGRMAAGDIAAWLDVPASTLSSHLSKLERAGLIDARRDARRILYGLNFDGARALARFFVDECCAGRPEICMPETFAGLRDGEPDAPPA